ncbi:MAG: TRAP transporter substrate-binding protein DctP, partial [Hyphomicrobiaceae bacterium]
MSRKLWEVAKSIAATRRRTSEFVVNEDLWQTLPAAQRSIVEAAALAAESAVCSWIGPLEQEAHTLAETHGMKIVDVSAATGVSAPCNGKARMTSRLYRLYRSTILLAALTVAADAQPAFAQPATFRVTLQIAATSHLGRNVLEFGQDIEARTSGALKIQLFDMGRLYKDNQVVQAVGSGAIEMGVAVLGQYAVPAPATALFQQPFVFNFDALVRAAIKPGSEIRTLIEAEILAATGTRVLWWQPYGATVIFSRSIPMTHPAAIAGRHIRVFDKSTGELIKACGGKAHLISGGDQYAALETGVVEAGLSGILGVKERDLWRVTTSVAKTRHAPILNVVIINEKVWQNLPSDRQRLVTELAGEAQKRVWERFAADEVAAYTLAVQKGMKIYEIGSEDTIAWR